MTRIADRFADRLLEMGRKVQRRGDGKYEAQCCAHDDGRASLSIATGDDGRMLLHCQAGCEAGAVVAAAGWKMGDCFPPKVNGNGNGQGRRIVAEYDYTDEPGSLLFQCVRYLPKDFRQRRPDNKGGWIWKLDGVRLVLFHLPQLLATPAETVVFLPEGEKDVLALEAAGLVATCNPMGAGKWRPEYSEFLRGRIVCIVADKDNAGRKHAHAVAMALQGIAADVRIVECPGNAVKDASDYLSAGGDGEQLMALFDAAPPFKPTDPAPVADALAADAGGEGDTGDGQASAEPILITLSTVQRQRINWLWKGRAARGKVTMFAGDPGLGKSIVSMDVAARISKGKPWPDLPGEPNPAGSVLILNCEDDLADTVAPRLWRAGADLSKVVAIQGVRYREAGTQRAFDLARDLPMLEAAAAKMPDLAAVIIDPISGFLGKTDSHNNSEVRALLAPLAEFAAKYGCAIICISHLNKGSGRAIYRTMGSLAFVAAARTAWAVVKDKDDFTGERRLMLPIKNNIAKDDGGLAFRITGGDGEVPCVSWEEGKVCTDADTQLADTPPDAEAVPTEIEKATEWLRKALAHGPVLGKEVTRQATKEAGISERTLRRAKDRLEVDCFQPENPGPWYWRLQGGAVGQAVGQAPLSQSAWPSGQVPVNTHLSVAAQGQLANVNGTGREYTGEPGEDGHG